MSAAPPHQRNPAPYEHNFAPLAATLAGIGLLSLMDATMKEASLAVGAYSALLLRSGLNLAVIGPLWLATRRGPASPAARRVHIRRGVVMTFSALSFFWAIARLPLAEGLALTFIAPIIALLLAALLLGETIRRSAILASLMGLAGVMLIALTGEAGRGGTGALAGDAWHRWDGAGWGVLAMLVSAVLYAWNLVLQRQQAQLAAPVEMATWQNFMVGLVLVGGAPWLLHWPDRAAWLAIAASGALSMAGALLFGWAYARAEAQTLAPLEYTGLAWAATFGWLFFGESVRPAVLAGAALILLGTWLAAPRRAVRMRPEQSSV